MAPGRVLTTTALVAPALVLAVALAGASPAVAHAELVSTDPEEGAVLDDAPATITLTFNEPVRLTSQEVAVYDSEGDPVEATARASGVEVGVALGGAADLADGSYVVVVERPLDDGHPISGALTFSVGAPSAEVSAPPEPETSSTTVQLVRDLVTVASRSGCSSPPASPSSSRTCCRARGTAPRCGDACDAAGVRRWGGRPRRGPAGAGGRGLRPGPRAERRRPALDSGQVVNELVSAALVVARTRRSRRGPPRRRRPTGRPPCC